MKFLHLSDLHIGKAVNRFSMIAEQKNAFGQIIGHIKTENPSAVVIAGDVYDRAIPSVEAVRLFDDFLTELANEDVAVLLISGNHDSPERLNFASRLLADKRIYFCGASDGAIRKVAMPDEFGCVNFWLLPFINPIMARGLFGNNETDSYYDTIKLALDSADIDFTKRNVLVSHQFFKKAGQEPERSKSELDPVGGLDAVDVKLIEAFDYAALGHLHRNQRIGFEHVRYCGSPIKYSFSEKDHDKSINLVELCEKGNLSIKPLPLAPIHDMREIRGELADLISNETLSLADRNDYLRVVLTDEVEIIDPMGKLRGVYPNIMELGFDNSRTRIENADIAADISSARNLSPYDLFAQFFLESQGQTMNPEQAEIVRDLLERQGDE